MNRSPAHRLIALWAWIVLLLNGSADAFGVHPCPHHDAVGHAPPAAAAQHGHGAPHGGMDHAPAGGEQSGHGSSCTCVGSCLMGTAAPLPRTAVLPAATVVVAPFVGVSGDAAVLPGWLPYRLPYATAPPARLA